MHENDSDEQFEGELLTAEPDERLLEAVAALAESQYWTNVLLMRLYDLLGAIGFKLDPSTGDDPSAVAKVLMVHDAGGIIQKNVALTPEGDPDEGRE